jgi:hypothetical protein
MVARGPIPCSVARKAVDDDPDPGIEKVMGIVRDRIRDRTGGREDDRLLRLVVESLFKDLSDTSVRTTCSLRSLRLREVP